MSNLDAFVTSSRTAPNAIFTTQEVRDRASIFVASIYRVTGTSGVSSSSTSRPSSIKVKGSSEHDSQPPPEADRVIAHHTNVVHASKLASHEVAAWRLMSPRPGRDGLGGPDDFEVVKGSRDDGEKYAGAKVLRVMEREGVLDAIVVVSRWYGGILLGPARFTHIETCATEACRAFKSHEEIEQSIANLHALDEELASLRTGLADLQTILDRSSPTSESIMSSKTLVESGQASRTQLQDLKKDNPARKDYSSLFDPLDVQRARRLVTAREKAVASAKSFLARKRQEIQSHSDTLANPTDERHDMVEGKRGREEKEIENGAPPEKRAKPDSSGSQ